NELAGRLAAIKRHRDYEPRDHEEKRYAVSSEAHSRQVGERGAIGVQTLGIERRTPAIAVVKRDHSENRDRAQPIDACDSPAVHECTPRCRRPAESRRYAACGRRASPGCEDEARG